MNIRNALYRAGIETGGGDVELPDRDLVVKTGDVTVTAGDVEVTAGNISVVAGLVDALAGFSSNAGASGLKINTRKKTSWTSAAASVEHMTSAVNSIVLAWGHGEAIAAVVGADGACVKLAGTAKTDVISSATCLTIYDDGGEAVVHNQHATGNYSIVEFILS